MSKLGSMVDKAIHRFPKSDARLPIPGAKIGIEVELEEWDGKNNTKYWITKEDHSLRNHGIEFVTNGPVIGEDIIPAIEELCALANARKYSTGEPRAGIHVHVDCTDLEVETNELAHMVSNYMLVEHALFGFAGDWREHCGYCIPYDLGKQDFRFLGKVLYEQKNKSALQSSLQNMSKYQALNLVPLIQYGTVEFRHLPTIFDPKKLLDWVKIVLAIKRSASDQENLDALAGFSKHGPMAYAERIMGDQFYLIRPFIDPNRMWQAVDNATAIMAHGNALVPIAQWGSEGGDNPLLEMKLEMMMKNKKKVSVKNIGTPAEVRVDGVREPQFHVGQEAPLMPIRGDFWRRQGNDMFHLYSWTGTRWRDWGVVNNTTARTLFLQEFNQELRRRGLRPDERAAPNITFNEV